jgi:hypothetical protein
MERQGSWRDSGSRSEELEERRESGESEIETMAQEIETHSGSISSATRSVEERSRSGSASSNGSIQVDWEQLDKTEAREDADTTDSDEVCFPLLNYNFFLLTISLCSRLDFFSHVSSKRIT